MSTSPKDSKENETFQQKIILVILGAILGALVTGIFNYLLQQDKNSAESELAKRKFKSDLIIQSLDSPSFIQALNNLQFIIEAGLIDDPDGKIKTAAEKNKPKIDVPSNPSNNSTSKKEGTTEITQDTVSSLERKGFQFLLQANLAEAQKSFSDAYRIFPVYHNVDEINRLLQNKQQVNDWSKEVYCPILTKYSWGMPEDLKTQMRQKSQCSK